MDQPIEALLKSDSSPSMSEAANHVWWSSNRGAVQFGGWTDESCVPWQVMPDQLVAVWGEPVAIERPVENGAAFLKWLAESSRSLASMATDVDGLYALLRFDRSGEGGIVTDPFGVHAIYSGETRSATIFSNKANLVAAAMEAELGHPVGPDPEALAMVVVLGHMVGDETGYRGVSTLPFGCNVSIDRKCRVSIEKTQADPWDVDVRPSGPSVSELDAVEDRMVRLIRSVLTLNPDNPIAELTAGRDSRLVLALLSRAGLLDEITFFTRGGENTPDFEGASTIADRLNLNHVRTWWPIPLAGYTALYEEHVERVSGQLGCWESSESRELPNATFSGLLGETLRATNPHFSGQRDLDVLRDRFIQVARNRAGPLKQPELEHALERLAAVLREPLDEGYPPEILSDIFFFKHQMRRRLGAQMDRHFRHFYPLYVDGAARTTFQWGPTSRSEDLRRRALMDRADLDLGDLGFSQPNRKTPLAKVGKHSGKYPSVRLSEGEPGSRGLIKLEAPRRENAITEILEAAENPRGFEIIDRDQFTTMLANYDALPTIDRIKLHCALTPIIFMRD